MQNPKLTGKLTTKIINEGSSKEVREKIRRVSFKTFDSVDMTTNSERNTKAIGIGLSTADALSRHLGGEFYLKDIKNDNRESVATEAVFMIPTCYLNDCHHYN